MENCKECEYFDELCGQFDREPEWWEELDELPDYGGDYIIPKGQHDEWN